MSDLFSDERIDFKCPKCGQKVHKTIGWLETHHNLTCVGCGENIHLRTSELVNELRNVRQAVDRLKRRIRNVS